MLLGLAKQVALPSPALARMFSGTPPLPDIAAEGPNPP
jgi:hypothetical protein